MAGNSHTAIHVHVNVRSYFNDYFILSECVFDLLKREYLSLSGDLRKQNGKWEELMNVAVAMVTSDDQRISEW